MPAPVPISELLNNQRDPPTLVPKSSEKEQVNDTEAKGGIVSQETWTLKKD
jgi:hypothetical protein